MSIIIAMVRLHTSSDSYIIHHQTTSSDPTSDPMSWPQSSIVDELGHSTPVERALVMCMERIASLERQVSSLQAGSFMLSGCCKENLYLDAVLFTLGVTSGERKRLSNEWAAIYKRSMASLLDSNIRMKHPSSTELLIELARSRVQQQQQQQSSDSHSLSRAMSLHAAAFRRSVALPPWSPECSATAYDWSALDVANMLESMDPDELQRMWQWRLSYMGYSC